MKRYLIAHQRAHLAKTLADVDPRTIVLFHRLMWPPACNLGRVLFEVREDGTLDLIRVNIDSGD